MELSKKYKKIICIEIIVIILVSTLFKTSVLRNLFIFFNSSTYFILFFKFLFLTRALLLIHLLIIILKLFYHHVIKQPSNQKHDNIKLLKTSIISCFILCEIIFMFVPQSQGNIEIGYGQSIWNFYYDKPINELNYRDLNLENRTENHKKNILFLGDSFTRGVGIKKDEDCFVSIIRSKINSTKYEVFNLGKGNSDTKDELKRLIAYPVRPDVLVLQYYHNDMQPVGEKFGYYQYKESFLKKIIGAVIYSASKISFFINFITLNVSVKLINSKIGNDYKKEIEKSYKDTRCLNTHLNDINNLITYCKTNNIKLYVVFIPELVNIDFTEKICFYPIKSFLDKKSINYISINNELKDYNPKQLTVGPLDNHANEFVQTVIANKILISIPELK